MFRLTIRCEFDSGHRLLDYEGPCCRLHGHHYVVEVTVAGTSLNHLGMLVDFGDVKPLVMSQVQIWDHRTLLNPMDPLVKQLPAEQVVLMENGNPTAENMAEDLYDSIYGELPDGVQLVRVRLYETPNCWVDYGE